MGIFTFLKKLFSEPEEAPKTRKKLSFSEIEAFIREKKEENSIKEKEKILFIKQKIAAFTEELREKIKIVNSVDIELKEKNEKIKSTVNEGRKKYIEFLERFIKNIEEIEEDKKNLEKIIEDINSAFLRLNESSAKSYERATILIGKEMGNIKESLKILSTELISIFNESKESISFSKKLALIESKINEINEANKKISKNTEEISKIIEKIQDKEKEKSEISEKIEKVKKSSEYLENIEKKESIKNEEENIEQKISELKQLIDFKALSNFFHIFEDRMEIVKLYRDDFAEEFKKDRGNRLLNLLNESKLNSEKIYGRIKHIQDKQEEIEKIKKEIKSDEILPLYSELEKTNTEIKELKNEEEWAEKNKEDLKKEQENALKLIKDELSSIDVDFE